MAISRAIIYHSIWFDVKCLVKSFLPSQVRASEQAEKSVREFEERFAASIGVKHGVAFPFARTALYFILKSRAFEAGSEIIMPPVTIKPMMDIVLALGLKPVLVDIERDTLCFDPEQLKKSITESTRAILLTYLFGVVPDVGQLVAICKERNIYVIEDFSHNLYAKFQGKNVGTFGDVGVYSCSATKTLDAYGGGLVVTNNTELFKALSEARASLAPTPAKRLRSKIIRDIVWNVATRKWVFSLAVFPLLRLLRKLNPTMEQKLTGARLGLKPDKTLPDFYFEQFTRLQATAGLALLETVSDGDAKRIANVEEIRQALTDFERPFPRKLDGARNVYWQFVIYPPDEATTREMLAKNGIDTATTNLSLISELGIYGECEVDCPNAEYVKHHGFFVPGYGRLSRRDVARIKRVLRNVFAQVDQTSASAAPVA